MKVFLLLLCTSTALWAQDAPRDIWDTGFLQKRPAKAASASEPKAHATSSYRAEPKSTNDPKVYSQAAVGLTIWRLRPPAPKDSDGSRLLIQDGPGAVVNEFVPERIDPVAALHVGERIRLSIEVPRRGFLYVIDRERYRDGTVGELYLIFPTLNQNNGANDVAPGHVIEIPSREAQYKALLITRSSEKHTGEDLILIVSPKPLEQIVPAQGQQKLPSDLVDAWDKQWSATSLKLDLAAAPTASWTPAEQKAGSAHQGYVLNQTDPLPATILSVPPRDQTQPILVHVPLVVE